VTRYLLASRVENETNNDLKSSLLGSERPSGLYNLMEPRSRRALSTVTTSFVVWYPYFPDILCCLGVMFVFKERDLRSVKRFPSRQKDSESVK